MSWFRKKGGYWYFFERVEGIEVQNYIGNDNAVKRKLVNKNEVTCPTCKQKEPITCLPKGGYYCSFCNKELELLPKEKEKKQKKND